MDWGLPPLAPQLGAARASLTTARQARRGDRTGASRRRNNALQIGSVARRHNARAQNQAVMEILRCTHEWMSVLQKGLQEGTEANEGQRFVDAFKATQMWLEYEESTDATK